MKKIDVKYNADGYIESVLTTLYTLNRKMTVLK